MANFDYCRVDHERCGRIAVGECSFCRLPRCLDHFVRSMPATAAADRPERERQVFLAAANGLTPGWACVPCRAEAGRAAVAALPTRPALPADPVGIVLVDRRMPGVFSPAEIDEAVARVGGYESIVRRIYLRCEEELATRPTGLRNVVHDLVTRSGRGDLSPVAALRPRRVNLHQRGRDGTSGELVGIRLFTFTTGGLQTTLVSDDRITRPRRNGCPLNFWSWTATAGCVGYSRARTPRRGPKSVLGRLSTTRGWFPTVCWRAWWDEAAVRHRTEANPRRW